MRALSGGFQVDSPVRNPVASKMARSAPPYTSRAREEPWEGVSMYPAHSGRSDCGAKFSEAAAQARRSVGRQPAQSGPTALHSKLR